MPSASPPATVKDVARLAGVHPGTVSRALNERTHHLVSAATRDRVEEAARKLDYRPNPIARGLKTNRSYTVGVLIPDIENPFFPPVVRGIESRLGEAGYTPLLANTENDPEREGTDIETMRARQIDGLIAATARRDSRLLDEVAASGMPLVLVNRRGADDALPSVTADDAAGIRLAVDHLAELGHTRIGHLAGPQELSTGCQRYEGFVQSMGAAGLEFAEDLVSVGDSFTESEGERCLSSLLAAGSSLTAVVAGNDLMALGAYHALAKAGLNCPVDVSVVGFNDMPFADRFHPPLTTIRVPQAEIGAAAATLLLQEIEGRDGPPEHITVAPSLVVRGSTAPPRSATRSE